MKDIPGFNDFTEIEFINTGLSKDKKYLVETIDSQRLCLRISDITKYERKKNDCERMKRMDKYKIPMSRPVDFGICDDGRSIYQLLTWCDGENLAILYALPESEQYEIGFKAGELLRKIHSVPVAEADVETADWNERYSDFIDTSIEDFQKSGVKVENTKLLLDYFNNNRYLLKTRPQCYLHGDYNIGNIMLTSSELYSNFINKSVDNFKKNSEKIEKVDNANELLDYFNNIRPLLKTRLKGNMHDECIDGNQMLASEWELSVVDWEIQLFNSYGDPWKELLMEGTPHYSTGLVCGYFNGEPTEDFWRVVALYTSATALSAVSWAYYRFPGYLDLKINKCADVIKWFNNMQNIVPTWYLKIKSKEKQ